MSRTYTNKFNRGEVDEGVMARDDIERVNNSATLVDNWMPARVGTMRTRPGTEFLGTAKVNGAHFLMPFVDDGTVPTILEFSQSTANPSVESVRFWINGILAQVTATTDTITNGAFASNITGWTDASTGSGAEGIAHEPTTQRMLIQGGPGDGDWGRAYQTLTCSAGERTLRIEVSESPILCQLGTGGALTSDIFEGYLGFGVHLLTWTSDGSDTTLTLSNFAGYAAFVDNIAYDGVGELTLTGNMATDTTTTAITLDTLRYTQINDVMFIVDGGYEINGFSWPFWIIKRLGQKSWSFELPDITDGPFGNINVTSTTLAPSAVNGNITLTASSAIFDTTKSVLKTYQLLHGDVYGKAQVMSVVSPTVANARVLESFGGTGAVKEWWEGLFAPYLPSPTAVEVYEGRLWLAGGARLYGSVSDLYTSFDELLEGNSASIVKTIGFGPVQDVAWLLGGDVLLLGLSSEEVQVKSNGDFNPLNANNANVKRGTNKGSAEVRPAVVDQIVYFVNRSLLKLFALSGLKGEQISANDTTILHPDICAPGIKKLIYSSEPEPRMYCLLTNGELRVLLFDNVEDVTAWSRITLGGGGTVEDITSAPTAAEDEIYMVVERDGVRYIERLAKFSQSRGETDSRHYDSHVYKRSPGGTFDGLDHLEGLDVYVWADGVEKGAATVSSGQITLASSGWTDVVVGLRPTATWTSNRLSRYVEKTVLNYRKRVVQIGLVMRSVALRNLLYGSDVNRLQPMPDIDEGRPRAPTTEPEPTIVGSLTGGLTINGMEQYDGPGSYLLCATNSTAFTDESRRQQAAVNVGGPISSGGVNWVVGGNTDSNGNMQNLIQVNPSVASVTAFDFDDMPGGGAGYPSLAYDNVVDEYLYAYTNLTPNFTRYDIGAGTWSTLANAPTTGIFKSDIQTYNGKVYLYGAQQSTSTGGFYAYDIATDTWSTLTPVSPPTLKRSPSTALPKTGAGAGKFYMLEGADMVTNQVILSFFEYNIGTNTWSALSTAGLSRSALRSMVAPGNGKLYTFGGTVPQFGFFPQRTLNEYDIATNTWSTLTDLSDYTDTTVPFNRSESAVWTDGESIFVKTGSLDQTTGVSPAPPFAVKDLWVYDIAGDTWTQTNEADNEISSGGGPAQIIDVTSPSAMFVAGSTALLATGTSGDHLFSYRCKQDSSFAFFLTRTSTAATVKRGIAAVDITDLTSPVQVDYLEGARTGLLDVPVPRGMWLDSPFLYTVGHALAGSVSAINISDPASLAVESSLALVTTGDPVAPEMIGSRGQYLYIAWEERVHIVDKSNPADMDVTVFGTGLGAAEYCLVDGSNMFVLDPTAGTLNIYSLADDALVPTLLGSVTATKLQGMRDMSAYAPYLWFAGGTTGCVVSYTSIDTPTVLAEYTGFAGLQAIRTFSANQVFAGSNTDPDGFLYVADQRSWQLVDYDEMSFEFDGTYDTDSRVTVQTTGPATMLAITYEVEDIDDPTDGSGRPN